MFCILRKLTSSSWVVGRSSNFYYCRFDKHIWRDVQDFSYKPNFQLHISIHIPYTIILCLCVLLVCISKQNNICAEITHTTFERNNARINLMVCSFFCCWLLTHFYKKKKNIAKMLIEMCGWSVSTLRNVIIFNAVCIYIVYIICCYLILPYK